MNRFKFQLVREINIFVAFQTHRFIDYINVCVCIPFCKWMSVKIRQNGIYLCTYKEGVRYEIKIPFHQDLLQFVFSFFFYIYGKNIKFQSIFIPPSFVFSYFFLYGARKCYGSSFFLFLHTPKGFRINIYFIIGP